jgi:hypothetical protein
MTDKIDITIRFDKAKADIETLKRILREMDHYKPTTTDKDEAIRQWKEEFHRRVIQAGLSR